MPRDPVRLADAKARLAKADRDLRAAAHELTAVPPHGGCGLSCTAGTGEGHEGFLAWRDVPFRKMHDLAEIGPQAYCNRIGYGDRYAADMT